MLEHELSFVESIRVDVWVVLSWLVVDVGCELWNAVLQSCHVSDGYTSNILSSVVKSYPWQSSVGNIEGNLRELAAMLVPPNDPTIATVWNMLRAGYPHFNIMVQAVYLLRELRWSSTTVEQPHGECRMCA